jgi:hypothetical protein
LHRSAISRLEKSHNPGKFHPVAIAALHQVNYATIYNYLVMELRYMDAGERGSQALKLSQLGLPGFQ